MDWSLVLVWMFLGALAHNMISLAYYAFRAYALKADKQAAERHYAMTYDTLKYDVGCMIRKELKDERDFTSHRREALQGAVDQLHGNVRGLSDVIAQILEKNPVLIKPDHYKR